MRVWWFIISLGFIVFALRGSFLVFARQFSLPNKLEPIFRYIPAAVLAGLVGPAFVKNEGKLSYSFSNPHLLAGMLAILVAWKSKNILATLLSGMASLWLFKWLLG